MIQAKPPLQRLITRNLEDGLAVGTRLSLQKWVVAFVSIELIWTFLGGLATYITASILDKFDPGMAIGSRYLLKHINFIILLFAILGFIHWGLAIQPLRFITVAHNFRWRMAFMAFWIWTLGLGLLAAALSIINPGSISFNFSIRVSERLLMAALVLILTPLQCIAEELLFRGMLWRMLEGRRLRNTLRNSISGLVFTLAHLTNPEVGLSMDGLVALTYYFLTGFLFMEITTSAQGLEAAIGAHIANNLFIALIMNYPGSSLDSTALFMLDKMYPAADLILLIVCAALILRGIAGQKGKPGRSALRQEIL
jgi:uncharacterized protein